MEDAISRKYKRVLEIMPDIAECAEGKLILVGGTALALFHLQHRYSIDLDFVPFAGNDVKLKENLKGRLTKKGYRTTTGRYPNQFVVQFEDTGIKIEVFEPDKKVKEYAEHPYGQSKLKVASIDELFEMKVQSFKDRREARDLFDIIGILRKKGDDLAVARKLVKENGRPENIEVMREMAFRKEDYDLMRTVIDDASETGN